MPDRDRLDRYVARIAGEVCQVFDNRVVGVWLLGSLAYGGFGPASDIDIQAAVAEPTEEEIARLVERINHRAVPCPAAGLEFVLYNVEVLRDLTPPLQWSLNLNGGPAREEKASTDPASESWHWFYLDLVIGRETAKTLIGRELRDVVDGVEAQDVRAALSASLLWHAGEDAGSSNQAANAARGLRYLRTGLWGSKQDALLWAAAEGYSGSDVVAELAAEGLP